MNVISLQRFNMQYRSFGHLGWKVSEVSCSTWSFGGGAWGAQDDADSIATVHRAIDLGVNIFDTAAGYGRSETVLASALRGRREKVMIVTKTPPLPGRWPPLAHEQVEDRYPSHYIRANVEERLRKLETECLDVLLLHIWTRAWNRDPRPLETLAALKQEGKIRAFGISTPDCDQDQLNTLLAGRQIDVIQLVYNLFEQLRAAEALPLAQENGVAVMVRLALDEGSLAGKWTKDTVFPEGDFRRNMFAGDRLPRTVERVERIRADLEGTGYTMPQAALKICLTHPAVSVVIPGMRNVAQAQANIHTSELPDLPPALLATLRRHEWSRGNWHAGK
jgi:aryl-alcohol dehydrogenase-like predicted oxidoreductase